MTNRIISSGINHCYAENKSGRVSLSFGKKQDTSGDVKDRVDISSGKKRIRRNPMESEAVHDIMEATHVGVEIAEAVSATGLIAAAASVGTVAAGLFFGIEGIKDLKTAVKEKDFVGGLEASGHLSLAGEAAVDTAQLITQSSALSGIIGPAAAGIINSGAVSALGTIFGVGHGLVEVAVGGKDIYDGIKNKDKKLALLGALNTGIGIAVTTIALVGGVPAGIALGVIFGTKAILRRQGAIRDAAVSTFNKALTGLGFKEEGRRKV